MDYKYFYSGDFAGVDLTFAFRNSDTASYFGGWLKPSPTPGDRPVIRIPLSDCGEWIRNYGMQDDGNTEFGKSVDRASDAMLHCGKAVIHASAIKWKGKALLFTADSGTGKSTQVKQWISLFKGEVEIINGDKPILQMEEDLRDMPHGEHITGPFLKSADRRRKLHEQRVCQTAEKVSAQLLLLL